jgi:hypothetical protein
MPFFRFARRLLVDAGSALLALPNNSRMVVFRPGGKQYEGLAKIKVAESATYATPVVAGNRIFTKDEEDFTLWTVN